MASPCEIRLRACGGVNSSIDAVEDGKTYKLMVEVEDIINGSTIKKTIVYDIIIKTYQSWIFST